MDYQAHYDKLIERARNRELTGYTERHHVLPRCLGGTDDPENIVVLTAEEHYFAHYVLVRLHPGDYRLLWAAMAMSNSTTRMERSKRPYGWLRQEFGRVIGDRNRGQKRSDESRRRMSEAHKGKKHQPHTEETKQKMSAASKGKKKSAEHIAALSAAKLGKTTGPHSSEWNDKIRRGRALSTVTPDYSKLHDPAYRQNQSEHMREVWRLRKAGIVSMPDYSNRGG